MDPVRESLVIMTKVFPHVRSKPAFRKSLSGCHRKSERNPPKETPFVEDLRRCGKMVAKGARQASKETSNPAPERIGPVRKSLVIMTKVFRSDRSQPAFRNPPPAVGAASGNCREAFHKTRLWGRRCGKMCATGARQARKKARKLRSKWINPTCNPFACGCVLHRRSNPAQQTFRRSYRSLLQMKSRSEQKERTIE